MLNYVINNSFAFIMIVYKDIIRHTFHTKQSDFYKKWLMPPHE